MINGLILAPSTEEYVRKTDAIRITLDVISKFPQLNKILVIAPEDEDGLVKLMDIRYYEDNIITKIRFTTDSKLIFKIIASNRLDTKVTALVYAQDDKMAEEVLHELHGVMNDSFSAHFGNYFVDKISKIAKQIDSDLFTVERRSQDNYRVNINGRYYDILDMASYAHVRAFNKKKLKDLGEVRTLFDLFKHAMKPKYISHDDIGCPTIVLRDGCELTFSISGTTFLGFKKGDVFKNDMTDGVKTSPKDSYAEPVEDATVRKKLATPYTDMMVEPGAQPIKVQMSSLYGSRALEKVSDEQISEIKDLMKGQGHDTFVPATNMEYEALPESLNESDYVIPTDKEEGTLIMEHQAGETHVKVYDNIGPEDAMPEVYTGNNVKDKQYLSALNHYKVDGSAREKEMVEIIEQKSVNFDILRGLITRATFNKFINVEPISNIAISYAIKKLRML